MSISPAEVERIAVLAHLELSEEEARRMAHQLGSILAHMEALRRFDPDAGSPVQAGRSAPLREDRVEFDPLCSAPGEFAPAWSDSFFVVPRLPALDAEREKPW